MNRFAFLKDYIQALTVEERDDPYLGYSLHDGKSQAEIGQLAQGADIAVPDELREFYHFSYGALLGEYRILTIAELAELIPQLASTYGTYWRESVLPFAYVRGVGDVVAFALSQPDKDGMLLVLDGFHELPPTQWKGICYGLAKWLEQMTANHFEPFWLDQ